VLIEPLSESDKAFVISGIIEIKNRTMFQNQGQREVKPGSQARRGAERASRIFDRGMAETARLYRKSLPWRQKYEFSYAPSRAEAVNKRLQLTGRLTITDPRSRSHSQLGANDLANTQGGVGTGPIRRRIIATEAPIGAQITSQQKQQVAGETEKQAGEKQSEQARAGGTLPVTENTGPTSYCGVLYFHFEPLDSIALGVTADLSKVQLNVRLRPLDDTASALHGLYCYVADALYGERADEKLAAAAINELNRVFAG
jgi:hypothetical protein